MHESFWIRKQSTCGRTRSDNQRRRRPHSPWNQVWVAFRFSYEVLPILDFWSHGEVLVELLHLCRIQRGGRRWARRLSALIPYGLIIKQRGLGQETHMPDLMTYSSCTTFLLHHLYCLRCTLLGLINIPHLLCNVFAPCKTAEFLLACKLHTCQSG